MSAVSNQLPWVFVFQVLNVLDTELENFGRGTPKILTLSVALHVNSFDWLLSAKFNFPAPLRFRLNLEGHLQNIHHTCTSFSLNRSSSSTPSSSHPYLNTKKNESIMLVGSCKLSGKTPYLGTSDGKPKSNQVHCIILFARTRPFHYPTFSSPGGMSQ